MCIQYYLTFTHVYLLQYSSIPAYQEEATKLPDTNRFIHVYTGYRYIPVHVHVYGHTGTRVLDRVHSVHSSSMLRTTGMSTRVRTRVYSSILVGLFYLFYFLLYFLQKKCIRDNPGVAYRLILR